MDNIFVEGLPISGKAKAWVMCISFLLLLINHNLQIINVAFDYEIRNYVSLFLLTVFIIFSIGNVKLELIVLGLTVFAIMSNFWDFGVFDISVWRKQVMIGSFVILFVVLLLGKVSFINLGNVLFRQLGGKG